ncbi:hypothetical protein D7D52_32775 [Nocardia yunnanensis]|uniref:Uncharacterized protein n=1 Tax=Nocardia yunnanensis TaxID=2382165 RepID=A0A386ZJS0_9NOCA|nr:hypothetical protein D7D52_32775 [Nocardia yunnanensis]
MYWCGGYFGRGVSCGIPFAVVGVVTVDPCGEEVSEEGDGMVVLGGGEGFGVDSVDVPALVGAVTSRWLGGFCI